MNWENLVDIYGTEDYSTKKTGLFILPPDAEQDLYNIVIK